MSSCFYFSAHYSSIICCIIYNCIFNSLLTDRDNLTFDFYNFSPSAFTYFGILLLFQFLQRLSLVLVHECSFSNGYNSELVYYGNFYSYKDNQTLKSVYTDYDSDRRQLRKKKAFEFQLSTNSSLHVCKDRNEAYSASYLVTKEHFLNQFTAFNLSWVNCEMGSYVMMYQTLLKNGKIVDLKETNGNGTLIQSIDVIDLAVIHLST